MVIGIIWKCVLYLFLLPYMMQAKKDWDSLCAFREWEENGIRRSRKIAIPRDSILYRAYIYQQLPKVNYRG